MAQLCWTASRRLCLPSSGGQHHPNCCDIQQTLWHQTGRPAMAPCDTRWVCTVSAIRHDRIIQVECCTSSSKPDKCLWEVPGCATYRQLLVNSISNGQHACNHNPVLPTSKPRHASAHAVPITLHNRLYIIDSQRCQRQLTKRVAWQTLHRLPAQTKSLLVCSTLQ